VAILVILKCEGERWVVCCRQPRIPIGRADYLEIPAGMLDDSGQFAGVAAKVRGGAPGKVTLPPLQTRDVFSPAPIPRPLSPPLAPFHLQELREETGIVIGESDMVDLTALAFGLRVPPPPPTGGGGSGGGGAAAGPTDEELRAPRGMYPSVGGCDEFIRLYSFSKSVTREELAALQGKATGNIDEGEVITLDLLPYDDLWRKSSDAKTLSAVLLYEKLAAAGLLTA
jgi:ADP-sugar diphosphatase